MIRISLVFIAFFISYCASSQVTLNVYSLGSSVSDEVKTVVTDSKSNIIVIGNFRDSIDVDLSNSTNFLQSKSNGIHSYILKYNNSGSLIWGHSVDAELNNIELDAQDNLYLSGSFRKDSIDLNFDSIQSNMHYNISPNVNTLQAFVLSLDTNGFYNWSHSFGNAFNENIVSICIDSSFLYLSGIFEGAVDFDPSKGQAVYSANNRDVFISQFSINGNFNWANSFGGQNNDSLVVISVKSNLVKVYGSFSNPTNFDPNTNVSRIPLGISDGYINKFNSNGSYLGLNIINGIGTTVISDATVDDFGNEYIIGTFGSSLYLTSLNGPTINSNSPINAFLIKQVNSTSVAGFIENINGGKIVLADNGNLISTFWGSQPAIFFVGSNRVTTPLWLYNYSIVAKLNSSGTIVSMNLSNSSTGDLLINDVAFTPNNNLIAVGKFSGNGVFGNSNHQLFSNGPTDGFMQVINDSLLTSIISFKQNSTSKSIASPNPFNEFLELIPAKRISQLRIFDSNGVLVKSLNGNVPVKLNLSELATGNYFIELTYSDGEVEKQKIVKGQ